MWSAEPNCSSSITKCKTHIISSMVLSHIDLIREKKTKTFGFHRHSGPLPTPLFCHHNVYGKR